MEDYDGHCLPIKSSMRALKSDVSKEVSIILSSYFFNRLVAEGIDVSSADEKGRTALHFASAKGHLRMVEALVKAGADVNKLDHIGNTPLHLASCTNKVGCYLLVH